MKKTIIIAEAGVNHNSDINIAKKMIDVASSAGADYVKFQTFKAKNLVTKTAPKADYQKNFTDSSETQFKMLKNLELDYETHLELIEHCNKKNIDFISTPFDLDSIETLVRLDIPLFKIPSGEITNIPYLRKVGYQKKPVILSTGMSSLEEVEAAVNVLVQSGKAKKDITALHCNTEYPTPFSDVNLKAMLTIKQKLGVSIGYSDHTTGIEVAIAATALGAEIIEKHFTLDRNMTGPDHAASLEPDELNQMVKSIKNIDKSLGNGIKNPSISESKNIKIARKSIVAKTPIKKGERFSEKNLTTKRPGTGISPIHWDSIIGKISDKDYLADEIIK